MSSGQGLFVAIEETDSSKASVQLDRLVAQLENTGHNVEVFHFPQCDKPSSYFIKQYASGAYGRDIGPYTSSLFYALDRYESRRAIHRALGQGKVVVANHFTGSSFARQGTKLRHAEERRGFFIWLDNLEFEMLKIPRPNINIVLRTPPEMIRGSADSKIDPHKLVEVYDDMCQLFPKDFARIDYARSGQELSEKEVGKLVWEKISPFLPEAEPESQKFAAEDSRKPETSQAPPAKIHKNSIELHAATSLLIQKFRRTPGFTVQSTHPKPTHRKPDYYTPVEFNSATRGLYQQKLDQILKIYSDVFAKLSKHLDASGQDKTEVVATAKLLLPVAVSSHAKILLAGRQENPGKSLLEEELSEVRVAAQTVINNLAPETGSRPAPTNLLKNLTADLPPQHYRPAEEAVTLLNTSPRNEFDLVPEILSEHGNVPPGDIKATVAQWPYDKKAEALESYLKDSPSGTALEKTSYSWDIVSSYASFDELNGAGLVASAAWQTLTPRYGYRTPDIVDDAGLSDRFDEAFDISLEIYSHLQKEKHEAEAQYTTLFGHKMHWSLATSASQVCALAKFAGQSQNAECQEIVASMQEKISEVHPLIANAVSKIPD